MATIAKERKLKAADQIETTATVAEAVPFETAIVLRPLTMDVGKITTNAEQVLAAVKAKAAAYGDLSKYDGDDRQAKADRALLRKQLDAMKTADASLMEAWNAPLSAYRDFVTRIKSAMNGAINAIDGFVKEGQEREKEAKGKTIQAHFDGLGFDLVPLERLFDDRWLNKTYDIRDVRKEIGEKISEIHSNLKVIEGIAEHGTVAKALYLDTLDMGAALRQVETLKANAQRAERERAERAEREARETVEANRKAEEIEARAVAVEAKAGSLADDALGVAAEPARTAMREITFRIRVTDEQGRKLRRFMTENGIAYEKLNEREVQ